MKRVISVQDISCFGKCSLTVALPVISAMGVECAIIPTAVLSTHTGGFTGFTFRDLSTDIPSILDHWKSINLTADALYSGYLGSIDQVDVMTDFFDNFRSDNTIVLVDPVMGDAGKLYTGFDKAFAKKMAELCRHADVIVPNLTEACFLLDIPYREDMSLDEQKDILRRLSAFGSRHAVLTGVKPEQGKQGALAYDAKEDVFTSYYAEDIPMNCH